MEIQRKDVNIVDISTIFALLVRCPFDLDKGPGCPFAKYRAEISLENKFRLAEDFSDEKRRDLLEIHSKCMGESFSVYGRIRTENKGQIAQAA